MAWTTVHKSMDRMSLGGREQQEHGKGANLAGWWTPHQAGFPVQSTTVKTLRCGLVFGDRVPSGTTSWVGCLLVEHSTPTACLCPEGESRAALLEPSTPLCRPG